MSKQVKQVDGVTLEVMKNALQSIAEEMGVTLVRTAMSINIKDRRDCSTGIYSADGELIAQAEHIPLHLGLMPDVIKQVIKYFPKERMKKGDAVLINDPYISGSHFPDCCLISPVFYEDEIIALVANLAHHSDMGGMVPGSMPINATDIFQEGIRISPCRVRKEGVVDEEIVSLIVNNTRVPDEWRGDLDAQFASNNVGEKRLVELFEKHGKEMMKVYMEALLDYSYTRISKRISELPDGEYSFTDYLEIGETEDDLLPICVTLRVRGDHMTVDFSGTGSQVGNSLNCTRSVACACVNYVVKVMLDPEVPSNSGAFRPIEVITPEGSIVNPRYPAAVSNANINTSQRIADALFGAFGKLIPEKAMGASGGTMSLFTIGGTDPRNGKYFTYVETYGCGMGAARGFKGADGIQTNMTNTRNTPNEVMEIIYPVQVKEYCLVPGTEGEGKWNGGMGLRRTVEINSDNTVITLSTEREFTKPWGVNGGGPGAHSYCGLIRNGEERKIPSRITTKIEKGDTVILQTPGGGGYGAKEE